ncbi:MAG: response regulator [Bdellovibrionia bacterium]
MPELKKPEKLETKKVEKKEKHILIVDDDTSVSRALDMIVFKYGKRSIVDSGNKAIKFLKFRTPDLILTDFEMQDGNGLELLEYVRSHNIKAPIIMITAFATKELVLSMIKQDIFGVIVKPFNQALVESLVEEALSGPTP